MAFLPTGMGMQVEDAEATIARQILKQGEYVFLHRQIFEKKTKKGDAVIIEHKIIEAKKILPDVEPSPVGTNWGYYLPKYGDAAVMLLPNLKAYLLGVLGLNEKQVPKGELGKAFDRMGGPEQACRGMLVRGVTFKTEKKDGDEFVGVNWTPYVGENVIGSPSVLKRRAEIDAELGAAAAAEAASVAAPGVAAPGTVPPGVPGAPTVPGVSTPVDMLAQALAKGWQKHPQTPGWYWHPGLPQGQNLKSEADLIAGR